MRRAVQGDVPAIEAYLQRRVETSMFPLSNLARFGLDGDHDFAPRFWIEENKGTVTSALCVTRSGTVLPALGSDPAVAVAVLRDVPITAFVGPAMECRPLIAALGFENTPKMLDHDEPQFILDLAELRVPDGLGSLAPLSRGVRDEMIGWRVNYTIEALGRDPDTALEEGTRDYEGYIEANSHRVLMDGGRALATTGFNASLPDIVQIGGVYTPPALRGRGYARRAVALHLDEARAQGVARATLFASGPPAIRAYEAIGFKRFGTWTLSLFKEAVIADG